MALPTDTSSRNVPLVIGTAHPSHCGDGRPRRPHPRELGVTPFEPIDKPTDVGHFVLMSSLVASLKAPPTVQRGSVLRYSLILTADGPSGLMSDVCPLFQQGLSGIAGAGSYELRCDDEVTLNDGQAAAYDLQLKVPGGARLGLTTLSFRFLEPDLAAVTMPITVVR
ncbi:MAG: hypothetical protein QOI76_2219 [Frankiales bacterium]|nr:hypothetical protein [Frankiales bacterium]